MTSLRLVVGRWLWFDLRIVRDGAHTGSRQGPDMTDWIDQLSEGLNEEQKRENDLHAIKLLHARLIDERSPEFFRKLLQSVRALGEELNEKIGSSLGGVEVDFRDDRFIISSAGRIARSTVSGRFNAKGQQITVETTRKGHHLVSDAPVDKAFTFKIDNQDRLVASHEGQGFHDPSEMASALLKAAFTADLFRPY